MGHRGSVSWKNLLWLCNFLFSRERPRSSQAGSTVIRVFDVGLSSVVMFLLFSFPNPHIIFQSPEAMLQLGSDFNGNSFISISLSLSLSFILFF